MAEHSDPSRRRDELLRFLVRINEPAAPEPDEESSLAEARDYDQDAKAFELENQREGYRGRRQDRKERKKYARHVFALVCVWLIAVLSMVFLQGIGGNTVLLLEFVRIGPFNLSDSVLITLVSSTTASIVAIFVIVARYLFPRRDG